MEKMNKGFDKILNRFILATNRSKNQTKFLLHLLDNDIFKLMELEEKLKNKNIGYCPGDKETCDKILSMNNDSEWFKLIFKTERKI